jgi:hypothetical protein
MLCKCIKALLQNLFARIIPVKYTMGAEYLVLQAGRNGLKNA